VANKRYVVFKNRNTTKDVVATEFMLMVGASTNRGLTGQGVGTKMAGIQAHLKGLEFARASHDVNGPYMAWYETEPYQINGTVHRRVVMMLKRPGEEVERHPMTIDANMFESSWAENSIGQDYNIVREPLLDAADEDPDFKIEYSRSIEFAPKGETWTYLEIPGGGREEDAEYVNSIRMILKYPDYFFRRTADVTWLTDHVGYADVSSSDEARLYITAEMTAGGTAPIAYVGYSNLGDAFPKAAAFDWILRETRRQKWAAIPKRTVEDVGQAKRSISDALKAIGDKRVLATVFKSMCNGGWEASVGLPYGNYGWDLGVVRGAFAILTGGKPVHDSREDAIYEMARMRGEPPFVVTKSLYALAKKAGVATVSMAMGVRESGETRVKPLSAKERMILKEAMLGATKKMPWLDWNQGHTFMAIESDFAGIHSTYGGQDIIGINFSQIAKNYPNRDAMLSEIVGTVLHELVHHRLNNDSLSNDFHYEEFMFGMERLVTGGLFTED
jgi:hypothetical protein